MAKRKPPAEEKSILSGYAKRITALQCIIQPQVLVVI